MPPLLFVGAALACEVVPKVSPSPRANSGLADDLDPIHPSGWHPLEPRPFDFTVRRLDWWSHPLGGNTILREGFLSKGSLAKTPTPGKKPAKRSDAQEGVDLPDQGKQNGLRETVRFAKDDRIFVNPGRGFYRAVEYIACPSERSEVCTIASNFTSARERIRSIGEAVRSGLESTSLISLAIDLRNFVHVARDVHVGPEPTASELRALRIDEGSLEEIRGLTSIAATYGLKLVLRLRYNSGEAYDAVGTCPEDAGDRDPEAPPSLMIRHLSQIPWNDILANIYVVELGLIGSWGEGHCSRHEVGFENEDRWNAIPRLVRHYLELVQGTPILLRYPAGKIRMLQDDGPAELRDLLTRSLKTRIGHHNDCLLSSPTDVGTYEPDHYLDDTNRTIRREVVLENDRRISTRRDSLEARYLRLDTQFVPVGGETCAVYKPLQACATQGPYGVRFGEGTNWEGQIVNPSQTPLSDTIQKASLMERLALLHVSYLNLDYHEGSIALWEEEGCFDELSRRLGYRLELVAASLPDAVARGQVFELGLELRSVGFARLYEKYPVFARFLHEKGESHDILLSDVDLRLFGPRRAPYEVAARLTAEDAWTPGRYTVSLWIPDPSTRLRGPVDGPAHFSIRLAGATPGRGGPLWRESDEVNDLRGLALHVTP